MTAFVAVIALALIFLAGMAYDGGSILTAHARARSQASEAARFGAQQLDRDVLRSTGEVQLDPSEAASAAQGYLANVGADGSVSVEGDTVTVTVTAVQEMRILPIGDRTVVATESATATEADDQEVGP